MFRIKKWVILFCTVALIGVGAVFPKFVFAIQQRQISGKTATYKTDTVKLTFAEQTLDKMRLLSGNYKMTEISGGNQMNKHDVYRTACELVTYYENHDFKMLNLSNIIDDKETPFLLVANDSKRTAVVWECVFLDEEERMMTLLLDDATGKLLLMEYYRKNASDGEEKDAQMEREAENFVKVTEKYYNIEMKISERNRMKDIIGHNEDFDIKIGEKTENPVNFKLNISDGMLLFVPAME